MLKRAKHLLWEWRGVAIAAPSMAGLVLLIRFMGLLQAWEWSAFDQYMRWRPQAAADDRVVIVEIKEADVKSLGQAIIPDEIYAKLIDKLKARNPRAIGLDIYRDLPVEPGHQALVKVFETTPNLVGIQKVVGDAGREAVAPPPVLKKKGQVGSNDLVEDADNKVRRGFVDVDAPDGSHVYSLSFYLALLYLDAQGVKVQVIPDTKDWTLGQAAFPPFESNDGGYVRANAQGHQLLINYRGKSRSFQTVSLTDVLNDRIPADWGRDKVILIGATGESFKDTFFTPYSSGLLSLPEKMAGVEIHANLTSQFISAAIEGRTLIRTWPDPVEWVWILLWSGVGATLSWQMRHGNGPGKSSIQRILGSVLAVGILLGITYGVFVAGWWVPIVPAFLALVGSSVSITTYVAHGANQIRRTFGRYLSDEIVANLLESPTGLSLGGARRKITILTSDLRGFTSTSERLAPEEVIKIINFYLEHMADVITEHQGTIDEFMGDGILVLFGAPTQREDDAKRAVACAVAMQLEMQKVNQTVQAWGYDPLEMGIGINTGEVVVGNIGSEKRTKYGVMGSQVNLTYRIESYTTSGQILISEQTLQEVGAIAKVDQGKEVQPKGVKKPIKIYDVSGVDGEYGLYLTKEKEVYVILSEAIACQYTETSDKHVGERYFTGWITQLSAKGAVMRLDEASYGLFVPLMNIKLNFLSWGDRQEPSEDIYAKILEKPSEQGEIHIIFTAKPPSVASQLQQKYQALLSPTHTQS